MASLRACIISIVCAALITGIITSLLPGIVGKNWIRFLCGVFISVTMLTQLKSVDLTFLEEPYIRFADEAEYQAHTGEAQAKQQLVAVIKGTCETYILDKAEELGANISIQLSLSEEDVPIPVSVTIYGSVTQGEKEALQEMFTKDMGIAKEEQVWIG